MKITFFALHLGFGGVEKFVITIANMLCEKYDVEIIATYKMVDTPSFSLDEKVSVKYLINDLKPNKQELNDAIQKKNIFKIIKEGFIAYKVLNLKKRRNITAIKKCNSNIIISTRDFHNDLISKYAQKGIIKISTEHNHHCGKQEYIENLVNSLQGFDYFLPISKELTSFYKKLLPAIDVRYIPFCIQSPTSCLHKNKVDHTYISVGRLSPEKGYMELIDDFKLICRQQEDAILHIVGDGELMQPLLDKIKSNHLDKNVIMHGFKNKEYIDQLYCQSSIYLMSSFTESFGFVLLEAMACGVPCIAYDSAQGANEIIKNGKNGYLICGRNQDEYIKKILQLSNDNILWKQMSNEARLCVDEFSYENTKNQWISLVEMIKKKHSL